MHYIFFKGVIISRPISNRKKGKPKPEHLINENIPHNKLFVLGVDGEKIGVKTKDDALTLAKENEKDLVLIAVDPHPIARILDYGRFKYDRKKRQKDEKLKSTKIENKQIRLTPMIGINDLKIKAKKAREFLLDGDLVKISLKFRGREVSKPELGLKTLELFFDEISDIATKTKEPVLSGKLMDMQVQPDKKKIISYNKKLREEVKDAENEN